MAADLTQVWKKQPCHHHLLMQKAWPQEADLFSDPPNRHFTNPERTKQYWLHVPVYEVGQRLNQFLPQSGF